MIVVYRGNDIVLKVRRNVIFVFGPDRSKEGFSLHRSLFVQTAQNFLILCWCMSPVHKASMGNGGSGMKNLFSHCPESLSFAENLQAKSIYNTMQYSRIATPQKEVNQDVEWKLSSTPLQR